MEPSNARLGWHEYECTKKLRKGDPPFYALIAAAMLRADTGNLARLTEAFPAVAADLEARHWAPGGILTTDPPSIVRRAEEEYGVPAGSFPSEG